MDQVELDEAMAEVEVALRSLTAERQRATVRQPWHLAFTQLRC